MSVALKRVLDVCRTGLMRRAMTTTGRMPEKIGSGGKELSLVHQLTAFTFVSLGIMGPGLLMMLTREKPSSEH